MIRVYSIAGRLAGLGLAVVIGGASAWAADLYQRGAKVPYDDPRYAYLYGRRDTAPPPGWHGRRPPLREWVPGRAETYPEAWRERYRYTGRRTQLPPERTCTPKRVVRGRLKAFGWTGFRNPEVIDRRFVAADADHIDGGKYRITLERCTGRLVNIEPLGKKRRRYTDRDDEFFDRFDRDTWRRGPYAWRRDDRDDRFDRYVRPRGRF